MSGRGWRTCPKCHRRWHISEVDRQACGECDRFKPWRMESEEDRRRALAASEAKTECENPQK